MSSTSARNFKMVNQIEFQKIIKVEKRSSSFAVSVFEFAPSSQFFAISEIKKLVFICHKSFKLKQKKILEQINKVRIILLLL